MPSVGVAVRQLTAVDARRWPSRLSVIGSSLSSRRPWPNRRRRGGRRSGQDDRSAGQDTGWPGMMMEDAAVAAAAAGDDGDGSCTAS